MKRKINICKLERGCPGYADELVNDQAKSNLKKNKQHLGNVLRMKMNRSSEWTEKKGAPRRQRAGVRTLASGKELPLYLISEGRQRV